LQATGDEGERRIQILSRLGIHASSSDHEEQQDHPEGEQPRDDRRGKITVRPSRKLRRGQRVPKIGRQPAESPRDQCDLQLGSARGGSRGTGHAFILFDFGTGRYNHDLETILETAGSYGSRWTLPLGACATVGNVTTQPIPTSQYEVRTIEGWKVYVNRILLNEQAPVGADALKVLAGKLYDITRVVPERKCAELKKVPSGSASTTGRTTGRSTIPAPTG
jgi:hypothetical protein